MEALKPGSRKLAWDQSGQTSPEAIVSSAQSSIATSLEPKISIHSGWSNAQINNKKIYKSDNTEPKDRSSSPESTHQHFRDASTWQQRKRQEPHHLKKEQGQVSRASQQHKKSRTQ